MNNKVQFSKMHGLGNDFMVIDGIKQSFTPDADRIRKLADRHRGVGFDQLVLIQPSTKADFACRFFNADGSEAEQCGNGVRCVARFIQEKNLSSKKILTLETLAGITEAKILNHNDIQVKMGVPVLQSLEAELLLNQKKTPAATISLGNPHVIIQTMMLKDEPVKNIGETLQTHPQFPNGVNVGFMEIKNRQQIQLRTFERGVGETSACGSNACAAAIAGIAKGLLEKKVEVQLEYGHLWIEWPEKKEPVLMTGPATMIYDGIIT